MPIAPADPRSSALLLDVDGTVLDLAPTPGAVHVPSGLLRTLERLLARTCGALALVSGRSIAALDPIFYPLMLPMVGGHGAELRLRDGAVHEFAPTLDNTLRKDLRALAALSPGILVEDKGASVAVHYRLAPQAKSVLAARIAELCSREHLVPLEILPGKFVIEVKQADVDKGTGVRELMRHAPFAERRPVFIGDDVTDEAAFAVLPDYGGIGYSVGRALPGARAVFSGPGEVREWLAAVARDRDAAR